MVKKSFKQAEKATVKSTIIIVLLAFAKIIIGLISNSVVFLTDGIHSLTDILTNIASFMGLKIAQKKADEKFPFGYYKAESLSSLFISLFIIYLAFNLLMQGFGIIDSFSVINYKIMTLAASFISIIVSFLLYKYLVGKGQ